MPLITVSQGGPDIAAGVYAVALVKIEGPKTITPQNGPNAGQDVDIFDWTFVIADGNEYDGTEIQATTSTASGPKSKMFSYLTALHSGRPPAVGSSFESADLVGKMALATISRPDNGWPKIENLGAIPQGMLAQRVAAATGAPTAGTVAEAAPTAAAALREIVEPQSKAASSNPTTADLPF